MERPDTRLFHLHYHVPDVERAEEALDAIGLPKRAMFGSVEDEPVAVPAGQERPEGFRFRLQDSQRGYANVTLTPGGGVRFDHLGVVASGFDAVVEAAQGAGWTVRDDGGPRTFLVTPWSFRVEVHPEGGRIEDSLGSWRECRFDEVVLDVADADAVRDGIERVFGDVSGLVVRGGGDGPHVPRATLVGSALPEERVLAAASLGGG